MDTYFECSYNENNGGETYNNLSVTCISNFAGNSIICTNGTKTYTKICPSSSPYKVTFENLSDGEWTVKTTKNSIVFQETFTLPQSLFFEPIKTITVDLYSASSDTVTFTDVLGSHSVSTNSNGVATNVSITFEASSPTITFSSSVAKSTTSFSSVYSKEITLTANTTEVRVMPDNTIYWFGYENPSVAFTNTGVTLTKNTNNIRLNVGATGSGIAYHYKTTNSQMIANKSVKAHINSVTLGRYSDNAEIYIKASDKQVHVYTSALTNYLMTLSPTSNGIIDFSLQGGNYNAVVQYSSLWIE